MYNKKLVTTFFILFIFTSYEFTYSQNKLKVGFDLHSEIFYYHSQDNSFEVPILDFIAMYKFTKDYSGEFNAGYTLPIIDSWYYVGPDFGISICRNLLNDWLEAKLNFTIHYNTRNGHESGDGGFETFKKFMPLFGFGLDIYTSPNICLNFIFLKPIDEKIYYSYDISRVPGTPWEKVTGIHRVKYFLKFGFSFYWDIL